MTLNGGAAIQVDDAGSMVTFGGSVSAGGNATGGSGGYLIGQGGNTLTTAGASTVVFSSSNALATTGNILVNNGTLSINSLTVSQYRLINIASGAFVESTGELSTTADGSVNPNYEVIGSGTLELRSPNSGVNNPDIDFNSNDAEGSTANWGTAISANIDLGSSQRYFTGQTNHNGFGVYGASTDAYITGNISGSGGMTFVGMPTGRSDMEMPFVFTGTNTFTGPVIIDRGSVYLDSPGAFPGGNDVTFNVTAGEGNLFLYGNSITIGTLTSTATGGVAQIAVGNRATGAGTYLPPSTLTFTEAADSTFNGSFLDDFYEYSSGGGNTQGPLSIDVNGPGNLTLTGTSSITGSVTVDTGLINDGTFSSGAGITITGGYLTNNGSFSDPTGITVSAGTLTNNGTFTSAGGFAIASGATLAGTGSDAGDVTLATGATMTSTGTVTGSLNVSGSMDPAGASATGILNAGNLSFGTGGTYDVELNGTVAGGKLRSDRGQRIDRSHQRYPRHRQRQRPINGGAAGHRQQYRIISHHRHVHGHKRHSFAGGRYHHNLGRTIHDQLRRRAQRQQRHLDRTGGDHGLRRIRLGKPLHQWPDHSGCRPCGPRQSTCRLWDDRFLQRFCRHGGPGYYDRLRHRGQRHQCQRHERRDLQ